MRIFKFRRGVLRVFWPYIRPYTWKIGLALVILLLDTLADLASPWPIKLIFDNVLLGKPLHQPWSLVIPQELAQNRLLFFSVLCATLLLLALISAGSTYVGMRMLATTGQFVIFRLRSALFAHLQQLSPAFYDRQRLGNLLTRLTSDIQSIQDMLVTALPLMLFNVMLVVGMLVVLLIINLSFGILGLVSAFIVYLVLRRYMRTIKQVARQTRRSEGDANALVQENLRGIRVVQAFGLESHSQQKFEEQAMRALHLGTITAALQSGLPAVVGLLTDAGTLAALTIGGILVMLGRVTIGDLLVFSAYLRTMYSPLRQLGKFSNIFTRASACAERVVDLLQTAPAIVDYPTAVAIPRLQGALTFHRVSFRYDQQRPALQHISFNIPPGMLVALVGHTGAGKSSILHLIQRFYDPQEGQILLDGRDIRDYTLASLRRQIALVPQEPMLFRASVRENIAYGRPGASEAEIIAAAHQASADAFIRRLPQGYDTILEEGGVGLSGGQRQCLAIARAILRQAPLLLLDEPTVGLDAQSEQLVVAALERLMVGHTTLVSAHRLSTIQRADLILVLDKGRIIEAGTSAELLAVRGHYYQFYTLQFGAKEPRFPVQPDGSPFNGDEPTRNGHRPVPRRQFKHTDLFNGDEPTCNGHGPVPRRQFKWPIMNKLTG
jgi:ATP-binding cassette subfamily B protein/subfamily B ATP-binding cassette protein MsbA